MEELVGYINPIQMKAKDKHRAFLLSYIGNWDNPFPNRTQMAAVLGIKLVTLNYHFTPDEQNAILNDGLELRKKNSAVPRSEIYLAMQQAGKDGVVPAQKEFLDRTEGKVADHLQHGLDESMLQVLLAGMDPDRAESVKKELIALALKKKKV